MVRLYGGGGGSMGKERDRERERERENDFLGNNLGLLISRRLPRAPGGGKPN